MKSTKEIAADCGLLEFDAKTLERVLGYETGSKEPYPAALEEIIGALYRRIEKLEEENKELLLASQNAAAGNAVDLALAEKGHREFLEDAHAFIQFQNDADGLASTKNALVVSALSHDIRGILNNERCFSPRVSGYAKKAKEAGLD